MFIVFVLLSNQLSGQWYYRHHRVSDPDELTLEQYTISKKKAGNTMVTWGAVVGSGCALIVLGGLLAGDDWFPSNESMLLGMAGLIAIPTGIIVFTTGAIINHRINKSMKTAYPETGYLKVQPSLINIKGKGISPGITLTISF